MKIIRPPQYKNGLLGGHDGSSFREIISIWKEDPDKYPCEVIEGNIPDTFYLEESMMIESRPWSGSVGDIMLYDQPILDKIVPQLNWNLALFANEVPRHSENEKFFKPWHDKGWCSSWTFWPNHPKEHEKVRSGGIPGYDDRENISCFVGSYTTPNRNRYNEWGSHIQHFWMGGMNQRLMSQVDYLNFLKTHKFGLELPGVGPKCLRTMELIGLGTVPIFTPGVSTDYYNKLEEGKHFLYAKNPSDIPGLIQECSKEKWEYMSGECIKWFNDNASPEGVLKVTKKIIDDFENFKRNN